MKGRAALFVLAGCCFACTCGGPTPPTVDGLWGGEAHICVSANDKLYCSGRTNFAGDGPRAGGQSHLPYGGGTQSVYPDLTEVTGVTDVVQVADGNKHSCVRTESGSVFCWGDSGHGELGPATAAGSSSLVEVPLPAKAVDVAVGGSSSCAVLEGGTLRCWGDHRLGQLGIGSRDCVGTEEFPENTPACAVREPAAVDLTGVVDVALGRSYGCAIADGGVYCWGSHSVSSPSDPTPRLQAGILSGSTIAIGANEACVVRDAGSADCWLPFTEYGPNLISEHIRAIHIESGTNLIQGTDGSVRRFEGMGQPGEEITALRGSRHAVAGGLDPPVGQWLCGLFEQGRVRCVHFEHGSVGSEFEPGWAL